MKLFEGNCLIMAKYDKAADSVNMEEEGKTGDMFMLLTMIIDCTERNMHISGAELAGLICSASGDMRRLTDMATRIDFDAIRRAKDKIDGNRA